MRIKVEFTSNKKNVVLKMGFLRTLQGLIYSLLDKTYADWLHEIGYTYEGRHFKLFTFSSILEYGRLDRKKSNFYFPKDISFLISSPNDNLLKQIASNSFEGDEFNLGKNKLTLKAISVLKQIEPKNKMVIKTLNPVTMRSTDDNKKYRLYYPDEKFSELINSNMKKKWIAFTNKECPYNLSIEPINFKKKVTWYSYGVKRSAVDGWDGTFSLSGDPEFLKFAYDTGLGERNSIGFGIWEEVK